MKYLTTFENRTNNNPEKLKYIVGDFIMYHLHNLKLHIIGIDQKFHEKVPYQVERSNGSLGWINEKQIGRFLNNDEIMEFKDEMEMYKNTIKYNL